MKTKKSKISYIGALLETKFTVSVHFFCARMAKIYRKSSKDAGILAIRAHEKCTILLGEICSLLYNAYNFMSR